MVRKRPLHLIARLSGEVDRWLTKREETKDCSNEAFPKIGAPYPHLPIRMSRIERRAKASGYSKKGSVRVDNFATDSGEVKNAVTNGKKEGKPDILPCPLCKGVCERYFRCLFQKEEMW